MKINLKLWGGMTFLYAAFVALLIFFVNNHVTETDTSRLLARLYQVQEQVKQNPDMALPQGIKNLPADERNQATRDIKAGALVVRHLNKDHLTLTVPTYQKATLTGYLEASDQRTSPIFFDVIIGVFAALIYCSAVLFVTKYYRKTSDVTDTIVAKIKAIERRPLTQSYLISEDDDKITTALNHLGETIQKQAESTTPEKENLYAFIEFFEFPIFVYDQKGRIKRTNAAFKNEFSDTTALDSFSPYPDVLSFFVNKMVKPTRQVATFYFDRIDAYYEITIQPLTRLDGSFLVTMFDMTAYKKTLIAHNDFIANVSHEFKTPLAAIAGFADILVTPDHTSQEQIKFAKLIQKESRRLTNLISDTLLLTKQSRRIKKETFDLDGVIQDIVTSYSQFIADKNLSLQVDLARIQIKSNQRMVYAIAKNLIENAINYTPQGGQVVVSLLIENNHPIFTVTDNGPGLTEIQKNRIFERFYRVQDTDSKGTGLGLAIVEKHVKDLGAHIDVISIPEVGTTFTVTF